MKKQLIFVLVLVLVFLCSVAFAFTVDLYETINNLPSGASTPRPPAVQLPEVIVPGWLIILEQNLPNQTESNWSDLVHFYNVESTGYAQLFSKSFADPWPINYAGIIAGAHSVVVEPADGLTTYVAGNNTYYIHSNPEECNPKIPEASSILLAMSGLSGIGGFRLLRKKS